MEQMTLCEVCKKIGISRRIVQRYEQNGLVKPTSKNKYGYLLYDEDAINRIRYIRELQNMGFKIREIKELMESPDEIAGKKLIEQIGTLEKERQRIENAIREAKRMVTDLSD